MCVLSKVNVVSVPWCPTGSIGLLIVAVVLIEPVGLESADHIPASIVVSIQNVVGRISVRVHVSHIYGPPQVVCGMWRNWPARGAVYVVERELTVLRRLIVINAEAKGAKKVLERLAMESKCRHVFSQPRHPAKKLEPWVLESQMGTLRGKITNDTNAGLHTLRHAFLTEAGECTAAFTLQYIAGHDTIKTTMWYVRPRAESVSWAFSRINRKKKPAQFGVDADAKGWYKNAYSRRGGSLKVLL
jgi:hypothetical protein